jgi:hypothetical protein
MYDARADLKKQNKYDGVLKHKSFFQYQNLTDWTYKWLYNLWYKYYFSSAAIDEICLESNYDSIVAHRANVMYSV